MTTGCQRIESLECATGSRRSILSSKQFGHQASNALLSCVWHWDTSVCLSSAIHAQTKALQLPTESKMPPKDKYTTFSRTAAGHRKSVHKVSSVSLCTSNGSDHSVGAAFHESAVGRNENQSKGLLNGIKHGVYSVYLCIRSEPEDLCNLFLLPAVIFLSSLQIGDLHCVCCSSSPSV